MVSPSFAFASTKHCRRHEHHRTLEDQLVRPRGARGDGEHTGADCVTGDLAGDGYPLVKAGVVVVSAVTLCRGPRVQLSVAVAGRGWVKNDFLGFVLF